MISQALGRVALAEKLSIQQLEEALENRTIPAYIGVPLLEEKIQMKERMQMAQAGPPPQMTIEDEVLQRANQLEQSANQPPMDQGIDQLPIPMPEYAGGGIIGDDVQRFQNQGLVSQMSDDERKVYDVTGDLPMRLQNLLTMPPPREEPEDLGIAPPMPPAMPPPMPTPRQSMPDVIRQTEQLFSSLYGGKEPTAPLEKKQYLANTQEFFALAGVDLNIASKQAQDIARQKSELEGDRREAKKYSVISAGLAILAGDPANSVVENIGAGLGKGMERFTSSIKDIAKTEREMDALERSLTVSQNQSRIGMASAAAGDYQAAVNRYDGLIDKRNNQKATLASAIMRDNATRDVVSQQMKGGFNDKIYEIVLAAKDREGKDRNDPRVQLEAIEEAVKIAGTAQLSGQESADYRKAADIVNAKLRDLSSVEARDLRRITREQGPEAAKRYEDQLVEDARLRVRGERSGSDTPRSGVAPRAAAPAGKIPNIDSVRGAPSGATIGKLVEGKGYEVLDKNGKVIGHAK